MKRALICFLVLLLPVMTLTSVNPYPLKVHLIGDPDFTLINYTLTDVQPGSGVFQFNATIQNNGSIPATTGNVPISWEKVLFSIPLSGGMGSLNESVAGLDLNGDGDKIDSFPVTWFNNETRPLDAIINDGVQDIHAYALNEGPPEEPYRNRTYYIDGKPKLFVLGNKTHVLYDATETWAFFGLDSFIQHYPSPNFILFLNVINLTQNLEVFNCKINGETVEINLTITIIEHYFVEPIQYYTTCYLIPNKAVVFDLGENITFSCIVRANKTETAYVSLVVSWSPDGNRRISKALIMPYPYTFVVNTTPPTSTTSATSTTSPTSDGSPGFSILTTFPLLIIIVFLIKRRRYN